MRGSRRLAILLLAALSWLGCAHAQVDQPGAGVTLRPAVAPWIAARPLEAIVSVLLEDLGYDVLPPKQMEPRPFYSAVAEGSVDFWANGWFPEHAALVPPRFKSRATVLGTLVARALQGYVVDEKAILRYHIVRLDDFRREKVRLAFDANGDRKADLFGCPKDWACADIIAHQLDDYNLSDVFNVVQLPYEQGFEKAKQLYEQGVPILLYTWMPNYTTEELVPGRNVRWIDVQGFAPVASQRGLREEAAVTGVRGAVSSRIRLGFPVNEIRVVANNAVLEHNPAAERLFELVTVPSEDVSNMAERIRRGEDDPAQVHAMAEAWVHAHRDEVAAWLRQARLAQPAGKVGPGTTSASP